MLQEAKQATEVMAVAASSMGVLPIALAVRRGCWATSLLFFFGFACSVATHIALLDHFSPDQAVRHYLSVFDMVSSVFLICYCAVELSNGIRGSYRLLWIAALLGASCAYGFIADLFPEYLRSHISPDLTIPAVLLFLLLITGLQLAAHARPRPSASWHVPPRRRVAQPPGVGRPVRADAAEHRRALPALGGRARRLRVRARWLARDHLGVLHDPVRLPVPQERIREGEQHRARLRVRGLEGDRQAAEGERAASLAVVAVGVSGARTRPFF